MIVFAVVLYGVSFCESETVRSLRSCLAKFPDFRYRILLLDNSGPGASLPSDFAHCELHAFPSNVGLSRAYNYSVKYCEEHDADYLVTLDQDSTVSVAYLESVLFSLVRLSPQTVVLCPTIRSGGRVVSPYVFSRIGIPMYGSRNGSLFGINSFSVYFVPYLRTIGGFDEHYWLDALDFSIFSRIRKDRRDVYCLDVEVDHDLSLISGRVSAWRFCNIMFFEACFLMEYCGPLHAVTGLVRLISRAMRFRRYGLSVTVLMPSLINIAIGCLSGLRRRLFANSAGR